MNNSFVARQNIEEEPVIDRKPMLRQRETEILELLEAIKGLRSSGLWNVLQAGIILPQRELLARRLRNEKDPVEMYRIQGNLAGIEKSTDLARMESSLRNELETIRRQLNGK